VFKKSLTGPTLLEMSSYTGQTVGKQVPINPGSDFLSKPFTRAVLTAKIREALDRQMVAQPK
jgi:FixJ family two-component response regulator